MSQPSQASAPNKPQPNQPQPRSRAELITFGIASLLLATVVGLVGYTWLDEQQQQPPLLSVLNTEPIRAAKGQFYVPITVTNSGGDTAESVHVLAELRIGGTIVETGTLEIDFLSSKEEAEGAFIFSRDPRQGQLSLRVASYKLP
ncbi:TIGR02588 family protein [Leptolyngbya sp. FACHB-321]|uniref:TIGR02588 family protein n=1 Tax=Leptolyngbya sp. FACHB-321 TaxID=2692807 RepID=UPI001685B1AA|nr:TIGR02588 family protein [Leptolyngbya sp. FACHB-321]MBD2035388.1 TIGR02588 family protein [Leptolyngbya sp. FACHB-321]